MSGVFSSQYATAVRFALVDQVRNRMAMVLLVVFVPLWFIVIRAVTTHDLVSFHLRSAGHAITVDGAHLTVITAGLNALTLIVGFMFFAAARRELGFEHRLVGAGYPRSVLLLAKFTTLAATAVVVSLYASLIMLFFWRPVNFGAVYVGFLLASLLYGSFGLMLGVLVQDELEGFFVIIMTSLSDTFLQNPIGNPTANKLVVAFFPSFGSMQFSVDGGFTGALPWAYTLVSIAWIAGLTAATLSIFAWKTRSPGVSQLGRPVAPNPSNAAAEVTPR